MCVRLILWSQGHIGNCPLYMGCRICEVFEYMFGVCMDYVWVSYGSRMGLVWVLHIINQSLPIIDPLFGGIDDWRIFNN